VNEPVNSLKLNSGVYASIYGTLDPFFRITLKQCYMYLYEGPYRGSPKPGERRATLITLL